MYVIQYTNSDYGNKGIEKILDIRIDGIPHQYMSLYTCHCGSNVVREHYAYCHNIESRVMQQTHIGIFNHRDPAL